MRSDCADPPPAPCPAGCPHPRVALPFLTEISPFPLRGDQKTPRFSHPRCVLQCPSAMVMFKKVKTFLMTFSEPEKVYCSGEKVAGRVLVEVAEVTRVNAVRVLACGVAKVNWAKGPQQCRQEMEYLRFEDVLALEEQPTGEGLGAGRGGGEERASRSPVGGGFSGGGGQSRALAASRWGSRWPGWGEELRSLARR